MTYTMPKLREVEPVGPKTAILIAPGDLRASANAVCWAAQQDLERDTSAAMARLGWQIRRGHGEVESEFGPHGFIDSQARGREVFGGIHPDAPLIVAIGAWQYSQHVLMGLLRHRGPVLILAN